MNGVGHDLEQEALLGVLADRVRELQRRVLALEDWVARWEAGGGRETDGPEE